MIDDYINNLDIEFGKYQNHKIAKEQKSYMRNRFEFYGIKAPLRRKIQQQFLSIKILPSGTDLFEIVKILWEKQEREYQYFAQELVLKFYKKITEEHIDMFEYMIIHKSWWDTVDFIATKLVGEYFKKFSRKKNDKIKEWIISDNIWLWRTAILFQLNYKQDLDTELLSFIINSFLDSKEFFINKAIGWILRHYSKTNPKWVLSFVNKTELNKLSEREALKIINKLK